MAGAEASADASGPRFAPDDPTLPAPWKALIDGATLYYWNPETNVTQYDKPGAPAPAQTPGPGAFAQQHSSMQPGQTGQMAQQQQQPQQTAQQQQQPQPTAQQPPFQYQPQQAQQVPYQQQQQQQQPPPQQQEQTSNEQGGQQPLAPQYPHMHPQQPMPYQHGPYMQPHQQQQQYSYQVGQQPQIQQNPYNPGQQQPNPQAATQGQQQPNPQAATQGQQPTMPLGAYNQGQQPTVPPGAYNHGQQPTMPPGAYNQGQQPTMPPGAYNQGQQPTMPPGAYNQGQRPPMPQAAYSHGMRPPMPHPAYNQGQQPQMPPHASYNQGQQLQGIRTPQSQPQHTQQSPGFHQPVQASQALQAPQSQGLQMSPPQDQLQHGFPFTPQPGKQPLHGHAGAQISQLSHGQQSIDAGGHEGKQTGFSLPLSQQRGQAPLPNQQLPSNHRRPEAQNQLNIHGVGGPAYPAKHPLGGLSPRETNNTSFLSSPAQIHQGGVDTNYRQQLASSHAVPNHTAPSPGRPPVGFKRGNSEDQFERNEHHSSGRFDGINASHPQPKLAALPPSQNHLQEMRNGPPYPQPDNFGGLNMAPPHLVQNPHNHGPFPIGALTRPPPGTFSPPDFPTVASVDAYRQHHEVTAVGENVPPPFMTFEATGFPPEILREVHAAGFLNPTPIQAQTWPVALQNRDIVAIAKTGSGKTLGYLIPAFVHLSRCRNNPLLGPTVLVLAPTRELASQIQDEAMKFGRSSRVSCTCLYGGAPKGPQLRELERGADIVVATPGRLNDILEMKKISLHQISLLVLDEADRMLDMGFEPQIRKIVDEIPRNRQTLMYTATWPKEVTKIAADLLRDPVQINIGNIDELVANKSITQFVEMVPPMDKQHRLEQILRAEERGSKIIIFCSTKKMCDQLARGLGRSFGAASIHGDKSQGERDHILNQFRTGRVPVLVATDVAARGLDIKDIRVVINYDFPTGIEDYVHRIGRTGRAGATGVAYTFFSEQDWKYAGDLVKVLEGTSQDVPPALQQMAARGAPGAPRSQAGGMSRWDGPGGGSRFESAVGGPVGYGGIREVPRGFGGRDVPAGFVDRDGPGGFGDRDGPDGFGGRDVPGGLGGRMGPGGFGGREGPGGFGGREGPGGFGGREGPGGFGGREGPGGFGGREGPGPSGFSGRGGRGPDGFNRRGGGSPGRFGGQGGRGDSPGFGGRGRGDSGFGGRGRGDFSGGRGGRGRGFGGRGRSDRGPHDRFVSDGRGRYDDRRGFGDKGRGRSYSRSPDRGRSRGYDRRSDSRSLSSRSRSRSRSWSRSRSRSRSWSRSRSRSHSRSRSRDQGAGSERRPRARSGFDVMPPAAEAGPALTGPITVPGPVTDGAAPKPGQSLDDASAMSPMSPGGLVQEGGPFMGGDEASASISSVHTDQPSQGNDLVVPPNFSAAENFPGPAVQQDAP